MALDRPSASSGPSVETTHTYSTFAATAVVIANMVGTGVFTSLGFQLVDIHSSFVLLILWLAGGISALCGALTYAELASTLPRSGGEYNFLSEIYHPMAGFISGCISATVGFAAPTALAAMTFGTYLVAALGSGSATVMASVLIVVLTIVHVASHAASGIAQSAFTSLKVVLILLFVFAVTTMTPVPQDVRLLPTAGDGGYLVSSAFAVSLIYVNYAYSGWNAATYIVGEVQNPQKNMPIILLSGTVLVLLLYLLLNYAFLYAAPMQAMAGKIEIGIVAARHAFGESGARIMGLVLAVLLISTVSAMTIAGPRVLMVIGEDFRLFRVFARKTRHQLPTIAIVTQSALALFFILSTSFESVLVFSGFIMGMNTLFAVAGVFILRRRFSGTGAYRTWGYPVTPLIHLGLVGWALIHILLNRPEAWAGLAMIAGGALLYRVSEHSNRTAD